VRSRDRVRTPFNKTDLILTSSNIRRNFHPQTPPSALHPGVRRAAAARVHVQL
jgi:hypothetical protein